MNRLAGNGGKSEANGPKWRRRNSSDSSLVNPYCVLGSVMARAEGQQFSVNSCDARQRELARARAPRRSRLLQCCERILHPLQRVPEK
jgi:hypothetical protein